MRIEEGAQGQGWTLVAEDGRRIPWTGLQTGPRTFDRAAIREICRELLGHGLEQVAARATVELPPMRADQEDLPSLFLHSTTPELKTFDGDADALLRGVQGGDFTTYKEARSVYLAQPGDLVVGRTRSWSAAVTATGADAIRLENLEHYYLSHALLHLARRHLQQPAPDSAMARLIARMEEGPRVVRLYAFELEMQILLLWLAGQAKQDFIPVEANSPAVASAWNRKEVLHPTVARAAELPEPTAEMEAAAYLRLESSESALVRELGIELPSLPGYSLERQDRTVEDFVAQLLEAAQFLRRRHGLRKGCLKASESGDGARITPGLDLEDEAGLATLGREAWQHGDAYLLEAHVTYGLIDIAGQTLPTALSAHIRGGAVAPKATAQFVQGTSWKGNLLLDEHCLDLVRISPSQYRHLRRFLRDFHGAFAAKGGGLVLAGIDFAIGTVGGRFGSTPLLGVQDLNVSFTGAECLRAFLEKAGRQADDGVGGYGVTRIYKPTAKGDHEAFSRLTNAARRDGVYADTVASIPGRWAMVGVTGADPEGAVRNLNRLQESLVAAGLIAAG